MDQKIIEFLKENKKELIKPVPKINWQSLYLKLEEDLRSQFTELMLSKKIDPSLYLKNIPKKYLHKSNIDKYTILDHIQEIGSQAFSSSENLTTVTIPNSVTSIDGLAFYACDSLASMTIPDSVITIGCDAFAHCSKLTSVTIGNSVTHIDDWVFEACESLTSIVIPNSVTSIGFKAFASCYSLKSATIPDSVTNIDDWAFYGCEDKLIIDYQGTKQQWEKIYNPEAFNSPYLTVNCTDGKIVEE
jgi:hypothetical protein